ncbi:hypothetical protein [Hyphomicrobium sp.]|uniref:hypothetical protein n=1 Tax=Hyphomicrobium sp. TaxID=82 RepID=UPI002FDEA415
MGNVPANPLEACFGRREWHLAHKVLPAVHARTPGRSSIGLDLVNIVGAAVMGL